MHEILSRALAPGDKVNGPCSKICDHVNIKLQQLAGQIFNEIYNSVKKPLAGFFRFAGHVARPRLYIFPNRGNKVFDVSGQLFKEIHDTVKKVFAGFFCFIPHVRSPLLDRVPCVRYDLFYILR